MATKISTTNLTLAVLIFIVALYASNLPKLSFVVYSPELQDFFKCQQSGGSRVLVDNIARCECKTGSYYDIPSGDCKLQNVITLSNPLPGIDRETCLLGNGKWMLEQYIDFDKSNAKILPAHCECGISFEWKDKSCISSPKMEMEEPSGKIFTKVGELWKDKSTDIIIKPLTLGLLGVGFVIVIGVIVMYIFRGR